MAVGRFRGAPWPPAWLAMGHGALAVTGVGLLIYAAATTGIPWIARVALGFFVLAALGGLVLALGFHRARRPLPIPLVVGHGLIAVTGFVLLVLGLLGIA